MQLSEPASSGALANLAVQAPFLLSSSPSSSLMQSDGQKSYLHAYLNQIESRAKFVRSDDFIIFVNVYNKHLHRLNIVVVIAAFLAEQSHIGLSHAPLFIAELVAGIELHVLFVCLCPSPNYLFSKIIIISIKYFTNNLIIKAAA